MFVPINILALDRILEHFDYQIVGMLVVFLCLGSLAIVVTIIGKVFVALEAKTKDIKAKVQQHKVEEKITASVSSPDGHVTPELIAAIAAAVDAALGSPHRIVHIEPTFLSAWSAEGRREIFASHRIR